MQYNTSSELKTILHSKRAHVYYLEHCRILVKGGRVEYVTDEGKRSLYWNIPIANTTTVLLGSGTSITQAAMRELAKAGVMVGFCGGDGTPLFSGTEFPLDIAWISPQSEYRPTQYLQLWCGIFFDESKRLRAAKEFQKIRLREIKKHWLSPHAGLSVSLSRLEPLLESTESHFLDASTQADILMKEARLTKALYSLVANDVRYGDFSRASRGSGTDPANRFLDQGNYLAYGLGATASWVLGLPHGLSVLHGKTRRGGLVFDLADLIKDAVVLPCAFTSAMQGLSASEFRKSCVARLHQSEALDLMIDSLKSVIDTVS